jgi:RNA polymerase sigma-70 factor (ECF subfamily)
MSSRSEQIALALNAQRAAFKAFVVARVGSTADAEDILQIGFLRAVQRAGELRDETRLTAWFYRVLRHAIIDHYRAHAANRRRDDTLGATLAALGEDLAAAPPEWQAQICRCVDHVVVTLKPTHAELLRRVELSGESVQSAAHALGLTANNASVTLHRARHDLRAKLEAFCGTCASNACLDCDCAPIAEKNSPL